MSLGKKISRAGSLRALAMATVVGLAYGVTLWGDFVFDDDILIRGNPTIKDPHLFLQSVFGSLFANTVNEGALIYFRPLVLTSYFLTYQIFGQVAWPFHLTNLLIHLANGMLLFPVLRCWFGLRRGAALAGTLLFLAHPVHTEAVAWISGRTDLLAGLGILGALLLCWRWLRRPSVPNLLGAVASLHLGLLAKELAVVTPALLLVLVWTRWSMVRRWDRPLVNTLWLTFILGACCIHFLIWRHVALADHAQQIPWATGNPLTTYLTVPNVIMLYARLMIWPHPFTLDYTMTNFGVVNTPSEILFWLPALGLILLGAASLWLLATRRMTGAALAWFFICIAPVSHIRPIAVLACERYMYMSTVCIAVIVGLALQSAWQSRRRSSGGRGGMWQLAGMGALALICLFTASRCALWRDNLTLFRYARLMDPHNPHKVHNLAQILAGHGRFEEALEVLEWTASLPHANQYELEAICLINTGQTAAGIERLEHVLASNPEIPSVRSILAEVLIQTGDLDRAGELIEGALALRPVDDRALIMRARVERLQGDLDAAQATVDLVMRINPERLEGHLEQARIVRARGSNDEAADILRAIHARRRPTHESLAELAHIEMERQEWQSAEEALTALIEIQPNNVPALIDLGYAASVLGDREGARERWERALAIDPDNEIAQRNLAAIGGAPK